MTVDLKSYYTEHVPSLIDLWEKYSAYDDVMISHYAGPQKQAKDYDPEEEQHFGFEVDDSRIRDDERVLFECFRDKVKVIHLFSWSKEKELEYREDHTMTHEACLTYLSQLPRPWHSFCDKET